MIQILLNSHQFNAGWYYRAVCSCLHPHSTAAVLPFAFRDARIPSDDAWQAFYNSEDGVWRKGLESVFRDYGILPEAIQWVNYFRDTPETAAEKIRAADIVYLCGGLPELLLKRLQEFGLEDVLRTHTGVVMGDSGGALVQLEQYHLTPDRDYPSFGYRTGLGLCGGFDVEPHFCDSDVQQQSIRRVLDETQKPVYAVSDTGALIVKDGEIHPIGDVIFYAE